MEILLLQDVTGMGKKNDLLVVGDGFALNFLLPQRKALVATPTVRRRYADQIKKRAVEKEKERGLQQTAVSAMSGKTVQFSRKAGKTGKLYAAITADEIVAAVAKQLEMELKADSIIIPEPIKNVGNTQVQVKVGEALLPLSLVITEQK
jgi:large subunit ribosomal protein L9